MNLGVDAGPISSRAEKDQREGPDGLAFSILSAQLSAIPFLLDSFLLGIFTNHNLFLGPFGQFSVNHRGPFH